MLTLAPAVFELVLETFFKGNYQYPKTDTKSTHFQLNIIAVQSFYIFIILDETQNKWCEVLQTECLSSKHTYSSSKIPLPDTPLKWYQRAGLGEGPCRCEILGVSFWCTNFRSDNGSGMQQDNSTTEPAEVL